MEYKWLALSNTTIATLMASIDTNIVLIALPTIGRELPGSSATTLLWILLGYSLITAVVLLSFGRLSDIFGRVRLYVLGFAIFTVGSLICGFSTSGTELVGFRMVQAIGAWFLFSNSAAILTDAFPPGERGRALGTNQVSIVVGSVAGLVLGGVITSTIGWQWIFFVNVPIGAVASYRAYTDLHEIQKPARGEPIDWVGNLVFGGGLALVLVALTFGSLGEWTTMEMVAGLVLGVVLIVAFVFIEMRVKFPMLDLDLFRNAQFTDTSMAAFLNAIGRGAFTFVMVFYLQGPPVYLSPLTAGLLLIPVSASLAVAGPLSGIFSDQYGRRWFTIGGLIITAGGFLWLTTIPSAAPLALLLPPFIFLGAGMGLFASPNRAAMMSAVRAERRGVASGMGTTLLNTGSTISLGITLAIMSRILPLPSLEAILLGNRAAVGPNAAAQYLEGVHATFLISAILVLIALGLLVFRARHHSRSSAKEVPVEITEGG